MARDLRLSPKQRVAFRAAVAELIENGELVRGNKSRFRVPAKSDKVKTFRGRIQFSRDRKRKSAFFIPEDPEAHAAFRAMDRPRIFIPGRACGTALDGDTVEVKLVQSRPERWKKHSKRHRSRNRGRDESKAPEASVVSIVERGRTQIVGKFYSKGKRATIAPDDGRLPTSFRLTKVLPEAKQGDVVVADFVGWESLHSIPEAAMVEVLGKENAPGVDMLAIIHRYDLPLEFPEEVLREAEMIDELISSEELERREDWRERQVFTIDPADAKDFDDAICVTPLPEGGWELAVHIADVAHYVKPGSALDKEASKRGNSVYLADRVIPMLPEKLSNGVCSLKPHVERLTHVAILNFDAKGKKKSARFASAVIKSHRRYSYEEAFAMMQLDESAIKSMTDEKEQSLVHHLKRAWELASLLRRARFDNGALDMDFPEVRVVLDEKGRAVDISRSEYDESHQLIEEFMLVANEAVAYETKKAPAPSIYRIHEDPDFGKLQEFAEQARSFGHQVGDVSHRPELQKLLKNVRGKLEEHSLKIGLLKSLRRAVYSTESVGHYGLAKVNYTHFTSPIRRYADLIVHRVLRKILSKRHEPTAPERADKVPPVAGMMGIADHISRTERIAAEAEMDTRKLKMIEYLEYVCREDKDQVFPATISEVKPIGAFCELDDLMVKGMIRKDDLFPRDEYFFNQSKGELQSRAGKPKLAIGTRLDVKIHNINKERGFIDFVPA